MTDDEKLRKLYRKEGWGKLAEAAGFDPVNTESSARSAFRFSHEIIAEKDDILLDVTAALAAAISLLERSPKKGAPSDRMFDQMLADYRVSLDRARASLRPSAPVPANNRQHDQL